MNSKDFFQEIDDRLMRSDPIHYREIYYIAQNKEVRNYLQNIIYEYFISQNLFPEEIVKYYLEMISEMRSEMKLFLETKKYSCKSEKDSLENTYSDNVKMFRYLNSLLLSQLLWSHHFQTLSYFNHCLSYFSKPIRVLDIGSGHGLYSLLIKDTLINYQKIDVVDISSIALEISKKILGGGSIEYIECSFKEFNNSEYLYDFIILGEFLEHLENPILALRNIKRYLRNDGMMWITVPTNSPARDHIYLFRSAEEVVELVEQELSIFDMQEFTIKGRSASIVCLLCRKK